MQWLGFGWWHMRSVGLKLSANRTIFYTALIAFRAVLDLSYANIISEFFVSEGFSSSIDFSQYVISWVVYLISFACAVDRVRKVSHYFFAMAILSIVAPLTSLYGLDSSKPLFPVLVTIAALYVIYFMSRVNVLSVKNLPVLTGGRALAIVVSLAFVLFLIVWFAMSGARPNLDLAEVYQYREANSELTGGGILAYTNNWTYQVFSIYLISFALLYKRYFLVVLLLLAQVYFFSIASHKSILFIPLLVFGSWMYFRYSNSLILLPVAYIVVIGCTLLSFYLFGDIVLSSMFSRRVFFVPANLCFVYFDFFSSHPQVYWSNSVLSSLSAYPYGELGVPYVVGEYLNRPGLGANNGFVSSGFAHAGLLGVFFYAVIIGFILRLINDMASESMPIWIAVAISVVPLRSVLVSSDLFTVMLTHGFGMAIILIYLSRVSRSKTIQISVAHDKQ